jgi:AraC-like DNA-binding protein
MQTWSTGELRPRERFPYWREAICRSVFNISIEAAPEHFSAQLSARSCGPLRLVRSHASGYRMARSRRDVDSAPADHYSVYLQLHGRAVLELGDETAVLNRNDFVISDLRHPFRADLSGTGGRAIAVIPHAMLDRRTPVLRRRPLYRLAANAPFVDLARRHLLMLTADDTALGDSETHVMTENLCNLVALAIANDDEPNRLPSELQIEALLAFCRQNLHNPELSPQFVADRFGISVRTLHLRFEQVGQPFGRWVIENRLDACRIALRDAQHRDSNISEIAYRCGFSDLSHFNKTFRARFGETPREWRHGVTGGSPSSGTLSPEPPTSAEGLGLGVANLCTTNSRAS